MSLLLLFGGAGNVIVGAPSTITVSSTAFLSTLPATFSASTLLRFDTPGATIVDAPAFYGTASFAFSATGGFNEALRATVGLRVSTVAALTAPVYFGAVSSITFSTSVASEAQIGGSAAFHFSTSATITRSPRYSSAAYELDGVDVTGRVRKGVTIRDVLNDSANTATLKMEGGPGLRQVLKITLHDGLIQLFSGTLQQIAQTYEGGKPRLTIWNCTATDRVPVLRPFGAWVNVSASTIAAEMAAGFADGFTTDIEANLPKVSITFDGSERFLTALVRLATLVGGYAKIDDGVIKLFLEDLADAPDPLDVDHPPLNEPPITRTEDGSQVRTRVYGKGYGENVPADIAAGDTILPISNGAQFTPTGGRAIAGSTADGAQWQRLTYSGVERPTGGTLVGPGAAPTTTPGLALAAGTGVESGAHDYAVVFVTAIGKSLPGPRATIVVGLIAPPPTAITPGTPFAGGGTVEPGTYRHYAVFKTASGGRTLAGPAGAAVTVPPSTVTAPTRIGAPYWAGGSGNLALNADYTWRYTFQRLSDLAETAPSPISAPYHTSPGGTGNQYSAASIAQSTLDNPPAGFRRKWYRCKANQTGGPFWQSLGNEVNGTYTDSSPDTDLGSAMPSPTVTGPNMIPLTTIPVSSNAAVTQVELYRELNNAGAETARLIGTVANGTTSVNDGINSGQLGGLMPTVATATANQVRVAWSAAPSTVTGIEIYRTRLGETALRLAASAASNAAGFVVDGTADAALGVLAPADDTSGLTQPQGQVNPGSPTLPVASLGPFSPTGGWVIVGQQLIRYTGMTPQALNGIPVSGPGALVTTVLYGQQATPAPVLVGVTGLTRGLAKGSAVHIFVQVDDLAAQADEAVRTGGDGIVEYLLADGRRSEPSLIARCQAELALFARPIITVTYATRDVKTKSGKSIVINMPTIVETLTIQDVTISEIDVGKNTMPRFAVSASSVRFSLESMLRRLAAPQ
jgi:hypothetical protein